MPRYDRQALLAAVHIVPAFVFTLLILLQLSGRLRRRYPQLHRWNGRLFLILGFLIGVSGLVLGIVMPFGGRVETLAALLMGAGFLFSLVMGVWRIRQGRVAEHRYWMLTMSALGFAPLTMRLLLMVVMAVTDFTGPQLFGPTMLLGMIVNLWLLHRLVLTKHSRLRIQSALAVSQVSES
jgi:uncharacterized membrane protein YozB (DUF420 family)